MEALNGNGDEVVDGNGEQVVNASANSDSCVGDSEANDSQEPSIGMEFESQENAYSFYSRYAKSVGFGISTKTSRRSKVSVEFIDVTYACTRHGKKRESTALNPRPCLKVGCEASLRIKINCDGKWIVHSFIKYHNHEVFPAYAHYFPCHRRINKAQKDCIETLQHVGVKTTKIYASMVKQHGGYENIGCLEKDIRNHLDKSRRLALESGDATAMLECFMLMQEVNPRFFYAIDLDDEDRVRNVFWVDAKGRDDYQEFGDVISFDTTYITNKYKMPFAPFIGVNNHFQSRLLGCALLVDETSDTFKWLMKTWLKAMGGTRIGIYTHEVFKKFQVEVLGLPGTRIFKETKDNQITTFEISYFEKNEEFVVEWEASKEEIYCLCRSFEFNGYLCRHSLTTLLVVGVFAVPPRYILRRWTKDIRSSHLKQKMKEGVGSKKERFDLLYEKAIEFLEEGSLSHESYNFAMHALDGALTQCATINKSVKVDIENVGKNSLQVKPLLDPKNAKTKGAPKRIRSGIEKGRKKTSSSKEKKKQKRGSADETVVLSA